MGSKAACPGDGLVCTRVPQGAHIQRCELEVLWTLSRWAWAALHEGAWDPIPFALFPGSTLARASCVRPSPEAQTIGLPDLGLEPPDQEPKEISSFLSVQPLLLMAVIESWVRQVLPQRVR